MLQTLHFYIIYIIADSRAIAGKVGAIEVIVGAMKNYINNANLCYNGCGALFNITRISKNKQTNKQTN